MATVTGYTAARIQEIEDQAIVSGSVVSGQLILNRYDGGTVNAGSVQGPQGVQGPPGDVSTSQLNTAISGVNDAISSSGLGLIHYSKAPLTNSASVQKITTPNTWVLINNVTVTFTPVPGRYYKFTGRSSASAEAGYDFVTAIYNQTDNVYLERMAVTTNLPNWAMDMYPVSVIQAPVTWNVSKTFKLSLYSTYPGSGGTRMWTDQEWGRPWLAVEDLGTL